MKKNATALTEAIYYILLLPALNKLHKKLNELTGQIF